MLARAGIFIKNVPRVAGCLPFAPDRRQGKRIDPLVVMCQLVRQTRKNGGERIVLSPSGSQCRIIASSQTDVWLIFVGKRLKKTSDHAVAVAGPDGFASLYVNRHPLRKVIFRAQPVGKSRAGAFDFGIDRPFIPKSYAVSFEILNVIALFPVIYRPNMHMFYTSYVLCQACVFLAVLDLSEVSHRRSDVLCFFFHALAFLSRSRIRV